MRFLVDANLSPEVARLLAAAGHDAVAVRDLGLQDAADDEILDRALIEDRVIVSHDTDFGTLLAVRRQTKPSFVLVCSADPLTAKQVAGLIVDNLDANGRRPHCRRHCHLRSWAPALTAVADSITEGRR